MRERTKRRFLPYLLPAGALLLLVGGGMWVCRVNPIRLMEGIPRALELIQCMVPPAWEKIPGLVRPALETIQIAFVGTAFGASLSFIIGLLAARNMHSIALLRHTTRALLSAERALPDLIVMLFFVAIVGLGALPGVMALIASSVGMLGKLFADAIEEIDPKPVEALEAIGATRLQIIRYAVLPQILPSMIANTLYRFEVNIRMSILLGAVGAGGIGFYLVTSMRLLKYQEALMIILMTMVLVMVCEKSSEILRKLIIGDEILR